ncbi:MAG: protease complex subunit PrcB family protein [Candidatus Pacebacteria bacterium]|nr:protease complex subunit PrcB family protein [Candidatus Paceibacterota bacterium]
MEKAKEKALLHEVHLVLGMVLVAAAIVIIVRFPMRSETQIVLSPVTENQPAAVVVPFTEVARGSSSTVTKRVNYFITTAEGLNKLWKMIDAEGAPPKVDFKNEAVVAVFAGQKPTAGYAIQVSKVEDSGTRLVSITLAEPSESCMVAQSLTAPYEIVTLPTTALPLAHEDIPATADCPK